MSGPKNAGIEFELTGDDFPHAWFFNRFRVERVGANLLITLVLATDAGGALAVNGVVVSDTDIQSNKERSMSFLDAVGDSQLGPNIKIAFSSAPTRVYPVNFFSLSRIDQMGEIGFYRFSFNTAANLIRKLQEDKPQKFPPIKCYPVVMFRCELATQIALLKDLYTT